MKRIALAVVIVACTQLSARASLAQTCPPNESVILHDDVRQAWTMIMIHDHLYTISVLNFAADSDELRRAIEADSRNLLVVLDPFISDNAQRALLTQLDQRLLLLDRVLEAALTGDSRLFEQAANVFRTQADALATTIERAVDPRVRSIALHTSMAELAAAELTMIDARADQRFDAELAAADEAIPLSFEVADFMSSTLIIDFLDRDGFCEEIAQR